MNHKEFVSRVKKKSPTEGQLVNLGYSSEEAFFWKKKFSITERKVQTSYNNELLALINNYDLTDFEVLGLVFFEKIKVKETVLVFGKYDFAELGIFRPTYEVILSDPEQNDLTLMKCAKNGDYFLESMIMLTEYAIHSVLNEQDVMNFSKDNFAEELGIQAGGSEYIRFYKYVLGI